MAPDKESQSTALGSNGDLQTHRTDRCVYKWFVNVVWGVYMYETCFKYVHMKKKLNFKVQSRV